MGGSPGKVAKNGEKKQNRWTGISLTGDDIAWL